MTFGYEVTGGRLYRYRPYRPDELRLILTGSQIRFSNAQHFNDPWDCRPLLRIPFAGNAEEDARWANWLLGLKIRQGMITQPLADVELAELLADPAKLHAEVAAAGLRIIALVRDSYRILCLSGWGDVPLMWSHYANSHSGMVEIFDAKSRIFDAAESIVYLPGYPGIDFPDDNNFDMLSPAFLTKADYWEYEYEFRIIAKEATEAKTEFLECHAGYVSIPPVALCGIIFGYRMPLVQRNEIRAIVRAATHEIEIHEAVLDEDSYRLKIVRVA